MTGIADIEMYLCAVRADRIFERARARQLSRNKSASRLN